MSLADSLARLAVFSKTDSHREMLDAATKLLAKYPSVDALHNALVALVRLDRYKAANDLLTLHEQLALAPGNNALTPIIAYIQYKIGSPQDVVEAAAERAQQQQQQLNGQSHRAALHVLAQYYYRAGKSDEALKLYHQLIETCNNSSEAADLAVNERAVLSQLLFANPRSRYLAPISSGDETSYDQLFNDALVLIVSRRYTEALSLLDKTHDIAQAALADAEADAQETFAELGPIALQKAYTHILLSQHDKALDILTDLANRVAELDANNTSDTNIKLLKLIIDTNRLHCLAKLGQLDISTASPHLLYAELGLPNSLAEAVTAAKITTPQLEVLQRNHIRLALATGKRNPHPHALSTPVEIALQAAADATAKNVPQRAIALLERLIATTEAESQPEQQQQQQLLVHPALGTLLHALYETTNATAKQHQLLTTIANTLLNTSSAKSSGDSVDYARFVALKLMPANSSLANALLAHIGEQDLLERKPTEEQVQELLSGSSIGIDVEHLVSQGIEPLITADVTSTGSAPVVSTIKLRERKRKRSKLPASYNADATPDPERWLPMKDRAAFKAKKAKKNAKGLGMSTQGGAIDADTEKKLNLNMASTSASPSPSPTPSSVPVPAGKKGKKKGKK
jgi:signal recognition particle subunit SRP72